MKTVFSERKLDFGKFRVRLTLTAVFAVLGICFLFSETSHAEIKTSASTLHLNCMYQDTGEDSPDPHFQNVKSVLIVVNNELANTTDQEKAEGAYGKILQVDFISKLMSELYTMRFKDLGLEKTELGCYGRHNQPVKILAFKSLDDRQIAKKLSQESGTLTAYLSFYQTSNKALELQILNYRPELDNPVFFKLLGYVQPFWEIGGKFQRIGLEGKDEDLLERDLTAVIALSIK